MIKQLLLVLILILATSCSSMRRSGKYVKLTSKNKNIDHLAKKYGIPKNLLMRHNTGRRFESGEWVFIPSRVGLLPFSDRFNNPFFETIAPGEFIWPVPASKRISSKFGMRRGKHHDGIDIPAPRGTHILAVAKGEVIYSGHKLRGYGNMTIIKHANNIFTVYAHAQKLYISKGDSISQGQVIGKVGNTGRSTGPHLHFELRIGDNPKNPLAFINNAAGRLAQR
jgi:murein DD-endopeptidase MepM/ murein hydrolase activator NlpD